MPPTVYPFLTWQQAIALFIESLCVLWDNHQETLFVQSAML
jgi:hypothetical protein